MQRMLVIYGLLGRDSAAAVEERIDLIIGEALPVEMIDTFKAAAEILRRIVEKQISYRMIVIIPTFSELAQAMQLRTGLDQCEKTRGINCMFIWPELNKIGTVEAEAKDSTEAQEQMAADLRFGHLRN